MKVSDFGTANDLKQKFTAARYRQARLEHAVLQDAEGRHRYAISVHLRGRTGNRPIVDDAVLSNDMAHLIAEVALKLAKSEVTELRNKLADIGVVVDEAFEDEIELEAAK